MSYVVQTPDEWLADLTKPTLREQAMPWLSPEDWLVVCEGFEERAGATLKAAAERSRGFGVFLVRYSPFMGENQATPIRHYCSAAGAHVIEDVYDRRNPSGFASALFDQLGECTGRIFIDISAMSRLLIVQLIVERARRAHGLSRVAVVYSEAAVYPPTRQEAEEELAKAGSDPTFSVLFLSSGVFDVTVVPELASVGPPAAQTRLITFPSLDSHQLNSIRAEINPSRYHFIEGRPPNPENDWRREVISRINRLASIEDAETSTASTLDYAENLDVLLDVYRKYADRERVLVCPTGSKMQSLAVGVFRAFVRDVQIVYPTPQNFLHPQNYTVGVGPMHFLDLDTFALPNGTG
jgi:hypothetical protein